MAMSEIEMAAEVVRLREEVSSLKQELGLSDSLPRTMSAEERQVKAAIARTKAAQSYHRPEVDPVVYRIKSGAHGMHLCKDIAEEEFDDGHPLISLVSGQNGMQATPISPSGTSPDYTVRATIGRVCETKPWR